MNEVYGNNLNLMKMKTKVFEPTIKGIDANVFPSNKKDGIRISLHNEEWNLFEKFFTAQCHGVIRNFPVTFDISLAYYEGCTSVFILSIDWAAETARISRMLPLEGFGQHLYYDFALAGHHTATQFCELNGMKVCTEMSHWPILQYVLEKR